MTWIESTIDTDKNIVTKAPNSSLIEKSFIRCRLYQLSWVGLEPRNLTSDIQASNMEKNVTKNRLKAVTYKYILRSLLSSNYTEYTHTYKNSASL